MSHNAIGLHKEKLAVLQDNILGMPIVGGGRER